MIRISCPVCEESHVEAFFEEGSRSYSRCLQCGARYLDPGSRLDGDAERAQYDLHENDVADPGYRRFLSRLSVPLLERLAPGAQGLDYGCGPGPALAAMMEAAGHSMALYDPFYAPATAVLERKYDFITCTEVAEHFHDPAGEFERLDGLLKPGGWLGIMTCFHTDDARFEGWHYRKDPTHVVFYREETMHWLANRFGWECEIPAKDIALMRKR
ncbi:class I SAM-dependent methyltransferase [Glycocaulis sp.]|uniref:class I SAM-dependent methyltransferase n=1 Tax=Glycocaulis sp. TaxID=1969725 RepID=UPI003D21FC5C